MIEDAKLTAESLSRDEDTRERPDALESRESVEMPPA
jgi:hypothetical protein